MARFIEIYCRNSFQFIIFRRTRFRDRAAYGFNDEHIQPVLVRRVQKNNIPLIVITKALTEAAKEAFIKTSCQEFMLIEEHPEGTRIYCPEARAGIVFKDVSLWQVEDFMKMITGQKVGK